MSGNPDIIHTDENNHPVIAGIDAATGKSINIRATNISQDANGDWIGDLSMAINSGSVPADEVQPGTITAIGNTVLLQLGTGQSTWEAQITGTFSAGTTLVFEGSDDAASPTNFRPAIGQDTSLTSPANITSISGPGPITVRGNAAGYEWIQLRCAALQSGDNVLIRLIASTGSGGGGSGSGSLPPNAAQENGGNLDALKAASGAKSDTAYSDTTGAASGSFITLLKGIFINIAAVVTLLTNPANPSYEYNSIGPGGGSYDRVKNVQGKGTPNSWTIASGGAVTGQPVLTLTSVPPSTLTVGTQIQLIGGTQEPAYIASISGLSITLTSNIVNSGHTSFQWDSNVQNGPLGSLMTAIGMGIRALALYKPSASATTPYVQAQADANNNLLVGSPDGAMVTQGILGDSPATSGTGGSWSLASLLRGILNGTLATQKVKGDYTTVTGLSANALNADLVPATDISSYKWWSLQLSGSWTATLTFAGSNDGTNFTNVDVMKFSSPSFMATTVSSAGSFGDIIAGVAGYTWLRVRVSSFSGGPIPGVLALFTSAPPPHVVGTVASQNGTWTVGSADGGQVTIGAKGDALATDSTSSWSLIALAKGMIAQLLKMSFDGSGNLKVTGGSGGPVTGAAASFVDGALVTEGSLTDSPATSGTGSSWSLASLLRGILNTLLLPPQNVGVIAKAAQTFIAGTINLSTLTNNSLNVCTLSLFNPAGSGKTITIFSLQQYTQETKTPTGNALRFTTADPAGTTGYTTTSTPPNAKAGGAASVASFCTTPAAAIASTTFIGTVISNFPSAASALVELLTNGAVIVLAPGNGIMLTTFVSTAGDQFGACAKYTEQ